MFFNNTSEKSPKVILTEDETMMSQYRGGMFTGFTACIPSGVLPDWMYFKAFSPPVPRENGEAKYSDHGLRIIESVLTENGFDSEEVAVVHPKDIEDVAGENTEVIGIGGHDILGVNPPTSEFVDLAQTGPPYGRIKFLELLDKEVVQDNKIVVGGKSAWQVAEERIMEDLGIDHVLLGEAEYEAPEMFKNLVKGKDVPKVVEGESPDVEDIPNIKNGTIHGLVEISRGCGRGCKFCTPNMQKLRHKSIPHIIEDVKVNVESGHEEILLHSEDVLRYGTKEISPNKERLVELFEKTMEVDGVEKVGTSHIALATAYHNKDLVRKVTEIATSRKGGWIGTQTGIETGSPELLGEHMHGKVLPSEPEDWPEIVEQSIGFLNDQDWIPAGTIINGLPREDTEDVMKTIELVDDLKGTTSLLVPMNFVSMEGAVLAEEKTFRVEDMSSEHWQLFGECFDHDLKVGQELKEMYFDDEGMFSKFLINRLVNFFVNKSKKYIERMKRGEPPRDYSEVEEDYAFPDYFKPEKNQ